MTSSPALLRAPLDAPPNDPAPLADLPVRSPRLAAPVATAALLLSLLAAGCGGGGDSPQPTPAPAAAAPPPAATQPVTIEFAAKAGTQAVRCGTTISGLGLGGTAAELQDLRFYLSNAVLIDDKGGTVPITLTTNDWQNKDVTLIDLEDGTGACATDGNAATNNVLVGTVPAGTYTGLKLTVGVPSSQNHTDFAVATRPMDVQAMAWSWQSGRKFSKIEVNPAGGVGLPAPATPSRSFYVHIGSTGCTGNPVTGETVACSRPDRMDFHFHAFDLARQRVVIDLAALLAQSNLAADLGGAPGCMSGADDPECTAIFAAMKVDLATGLPIDEGHGQAVFVAQTK